MKKFLQHRKGVFVLLLALCLGMGMTYAADFSATCSTGQTLYYNITDATNHYVEITCPGTPNEGGWQGFTKPSGNITLPSYVTYNNVTYTVKAIGNYAFCFCSDLTGSLSIPNTVTSIGWMAFFGCGGFTGSLSIPGTTIGNYAFTGCYGFTGTLTIGTAMTSIGTNAFHLCSGFTSVVFNAVNCADVTANDKPFEGCGGSLTIGNNVHRIPAYMFNEGTGFTGILTIGANVTSIGQSAFKNCTGFTKVVYEAINCASLAIETLPFEGCTATTLTFGNAVQIIPAYLFYQCSNFTGSLTIPSSVTYIGPSAFNGYDGFTGSLTIPNSVTTIGATAFSFCTGFRGTLTLGNSVDLIGPGAFQHCKFTGSLTIPSSVTHLHIDAFACCTGFTQINFNAINCADVTDSAQPFDACTATTLTIGSSVQRIPAYMFNGCSNFTGTLTIPTSVTSIGEGAFKDCDHISHLNFNAINCADFSYADKPFENIGGALVGGCSLTFGNNVQRIPDCIFSYTPTISGSLTIPNSVTTIGSSAFENCYNLTGSLTIPNSVTTIETEAFYGCESFNGSLTLGNSLTTIGEGAFDGCSGFTGSLTIPNSVTLIGPHAFQDCAGFNGSLTLGNSLVEIDELTFNNCSGFTGPLTIPNSVTIINNEAFCGCSGFTGSLTLGNSVTYIGFHAFEDCSGFTGSLTIPNSVTSIGIGAFEDCDSFNGILTIGSSVTSIGNFAFKNCSGFSSMTALPETPPTLGASVFDNVPTTIPVYVPCESLSAYQSASGWSAFTNMQVFGCDPLTYSINPDGVSVTVTGHVDGVYASGELIIPETKTIDGVTYTVTAIGYRAFYNCNSLTGSLTIPNSVTSIGPQAFQGCIGFHGSLTLGNSVTMIDQAAFYGCTHFTGSLTIPDSVTEIRNSAFWNCSGFTGSLIIPNSVTLIGYTAFQQCTGFTSLTIGTGVTSIDSGAFYRCTGFTQVNYNAINCNDLTEDTKPFLGCTTPTTLTIGSSVQRIPAYMFYQCSNFIGSLSIPNSVTSIGNYAFSECSGFTGSLSLGNQLTTIGAFAFGHCGFTGLLNIPNSVTTIGNQAFVYCIGFTGDLVIPNSLTVIGLNIFGSCSGFNGMLTIGSSVTTINSYAFVNCTGLTSMTVLPEVPPTMGNYVFNNVPTDIPVYVPCESLEDYQSATGWSSFTNMQCIPEPILTVYDGTNYSRMVPAYMYYFDDFTRSQFVIPAADLAQMNGNTINTIKFYVNSQTSSSYVPYTSLSTVDVYLKEVDYTTISAFEPKENATIVYQGKLEVVANRDDIGTMTITLTEPFDYQGGNLLIGIENTTDFGYKNIYFTGANVTGASVAGSHSGSLSQVTASQQNFIPKTTFTYEPTSSCPKIEDITFYEIGPNFAYIIWSGGSGTFNVEYKKASDEEWTTFVADYNGNGVIFNNLDPATSYLVRIQSVCGDEVSSWKATSFTTTCQVISSYPWFTDFESYTGTTVGSTNNLPMCWHYINMCTSSNYAGHPVIFTQNQYAYSGDNYLRFYSYYSADPQDQYAILPEMEGLDGKQIKLYARGYQNGNSFKIGMMTDPTDASTFVEIATQTLTTTYQEYVYTLGQGNHVAIMMEAAVSGTVGVFIDDIMVSTNPPHDITVSNITYNSADLSWQGSGACFDMRYRKKNFCEFIDTGFEGGTLPPGWTNEGPNVWTVGQGDGCDSYPIAPREGSYNAKIVHQNNNEETYLVTNSMDLSQQNDLTLYLNFLNRDFNGNVDEFGVYYRVNNGVWNEIFHTAEAHDTWTFLYLQLPSGAYATNCQLGFKMVDRWGYGVCLDGMSLGNMSNPVAWTNIQCQLFTEQLTNLDAYTTYQVQVKNCEDEGEDAWQPGIPLEFTTLSDFIQFADANVKAICVANWDTNGDDELSYSEAAAVTSLNPTGNYNTSPFYNNRNITSFDELQYFTGLTSIQQYSFYYCTNLTSFILPSSVTSIGNEAFNHCSSLSSFTIPSDVTSIGNYAFKSCVGLTSITFPNNLTSIGSLAFQDCTGLTSLNIPSSVTSLSSNPFAGCSGLESITVEGGNTVYDSRGDCNAIIKISNNLLVAGCNNTVIPNNVTSIGSYAFLSCTDLTSITIPNTVTSIGSGVFSGCTGLTSITVEAITPPTLGTNAFQNVPLDIPVYVPCGTLAAYQAAEGWSTFNSIVDPCATVTQTIELSEGWNWVSFNVEGDPVEMLQALEAGLEDNALEIQSFNSSTEYDGEWWGELDDIGITSDQMYMILVSNACTVELEGMPVNVSGCEIAINPGWNWIGYPGAEAMDIIVAFAEFEAEMEDVIQAAEIQTEYDGEWWGDLETLEPGQGYMYFSNSEEVKTLVFPTVGSKARAKARSFSGKAPKMSVERKSEPRE